MVRVLVVDDEPLEGKAIRFILEKERPMVELIGYANSGRAGIDQAQSIKPHIAFVDIQMPGLNGIMTTKALKEIDPQLKVAMISAYDDFYYIQDSIKMGASDYLLKPARPQELLKVFDKLVEDLPEVNSLFNHDNRQTEKPRFESNFMGPRIVMNSEGYKQLAEEVRSGDFSAAHKLLNELWQEINLSADGNLEFIHARSIELATTMMQFISYSDNLPEGLDIVYRSFVKGIASAKTIFTIETCLKELVENCLSLLNQSPGDTGYELISIAKDYIQKNLNKDITLEEVAQHIHLSTFYFSRLFKEKAGLKYIDYLIELRLEKAKWLLLTTNDSVSSIAKAVGYAETNSFGRLFKTRIGVNPSEYRSMKKQIN